MMPQMLTVRIKHKHARGFGLWIPVLPVLLILSPVLVLAVLAGIVACLMYRIRPLRAFGIGWRLLCSLPGTRVDVVQGATKVLVSVR